MDVYDMDEINEALIHLEGLADTFTAMNKDIEVTPERSRRKCWCKDRSALALP